MNKFKITIFIFIFFTGIYVIRVIKSRGCQGLLSNVSPQVWRHFDPVESPQNPSGNRRLTFYTGLLALEPVVPGNGPLRPIRFGSIHEPGVNPELTYRRR